MSHFEAGEARAMRRRREADAAVASLALDGRLMNTLAIEGNCREADPLACAYCGGPVCLCGISDYQMAREKWRVKSERLRVWHSACVPNEKKAVA